MKKTFPHATCDVCSKPYNDLSCHQCLHHEIVKSGSQQVFKCRTCERSISIPVGVASVLRQNLHLGFEVQVAGYMPKIVSNSEVCSDECIDGHNGPAEVLCCICCQFLCKLCHDCQIDTCSRKLSILDQEGAKHVQTTMKPKEYYCSQPNHEDNKLNFYCETCNLLVCLYCTEVAHKDHGVTEISTAAEAHRGNMRGTLQCVQDTLAGAIDANKKTMKQVETSKHEAELAINQTFEKLCEKLEERKKALLSELENIVVTQTTFLTFQKEQLEKIQHGISHYTEVTSHILQIHTDHEVIAMAGLIPAELKVTLRKVQNISFSTSQYGHISAHVQTDSIIEQLSKFGDVFDQAPVPCKSIITFPSVSRIDTKCLMKLDTRMLNGERYPHGGIQVEAELRPKSHDGAVVLGQVEDHGDGTYTITLTPQTAGPHQLVITMDGQHVQNSPHDLEVRSKRAAYLSLCNAQQVIKCMCPTDVAIHDNGDIYVASFCSCIYVFDQTGQLKNTIGSGGNGDGQFSSPRGIYIKGDMLYVADCGNHCVQKLSSSGEFFHKFGQQGSGQGQFDGPSAVIVDSNNRLIVSDTGNHRIQIFNEVGGWILAIGGNMLMFPRSLALDPQGNICVAVRGSHSIKVFTKEGVYVRMYGEPNDPRGIAIDDEGYSLVSEYNSSCLSIYDPQGKKIHTAGILNNPYGTALDPRDSSVYVASYNTNAVFKFSI